MAYRVDKRYYERADIERFEQVKGLIENGFEERGEVLRVEESGMFSASGKKKVWQIKEGVHNPMEREYCKETGFDIYGFRETEISPDQAVQVLARKIKALKGRFGES